MAKMLQGTYITAATRDVGKGSQVVVVSATHQGLVDRFLDMLEDLLPPRAISRVERRGCAAGVVVDSKVATPQQTAGAVYKARHEVNEIAERRRKNEESYWSE